jgi:hypothetical protein
MFAGMWLAGLMAAAQPAGPAACPDVSGVWAQPNGARILVMEQDGCRLTATVQEPKAVLTVKGFWTDGVWMMAASRAQGDGCGTTAWGVIRADGPERLLINVRGSDGLCGDGPSEFDATMTYLKKTPPAAKR